MRPPTPARLIAHLDMDAFYASVELLRRPELKGLPVVIGGRRASAWEPGGDWPRLGAYTGRGVVTTATYAARAHGVHSGMGLMKAAALAPQAILLPADFDEYRRFSQRFKAAVAELAPRMEDRGIDEIYIDLSDVPRARMPIGHDPLGGARALALDIKNHVRQATGLTCSIGLAPNKLLAKISSDLDKPDGLTVLMAEDVPTRLWPLPVRRIHGVGPKAGTQLEALGLHSVGDLAACSLDRLTAHFGTRQGQWLHDAAHGRDDRPLITHSEPVSISRETTFERDLHPRGDRERLRHAFTELCHHVAAKLQRQGYVGRTVSIKLRFDDFRTVTRDHTLPEPTADGAAIREAAGLCLTRVLLTRRLRLLGVRVGHLSRVGLPSRDHAVPTGRARTLAPVVGAASSLRPSPRPTRPVDTQTLPLFEVDTGDTTSQGAE